MRSMMILPLMLLAGHAAAAESAVQQQRYVVLGRFAGLVVACGVASEDESSEMVRRLGENFEQPWPKAAAARFETARAEGRKADCRNPGLRDAIAKSWGNYRDVK